MHRFSIAFLLAGIYWVQRYHTNAHPSTRETEDWPLTTDHWPLIS